MNLFYTPDISSDTYTLSEEESKHCIKILRLKVGNIVQLTDGRGGLYKAEIVDANPKKTVVVIIETKLEYGKRNFFLHIATAPTKNIARMEWFLEKATEIGIDEITPVKCEHSERVNIKTERLNKVITSAVKQSLKAYHPKINELVRFKDFVNLNFKGQKFIAHCRPEERSSLKEAYKKGENALILIGPEGDFSMNEIKLAIERGFQPINLGSCRLRTETAALVACHTINLMNE